PRFVELLGDQAELGCADDHRTVGKQAMLHDGWILLFRFELYRRRLLHFCGYLQLVTILPLCPGGCWRCDWRRLKKNLFTGSRQFIPIKSRPDLRERIVGIATYKPHCADHNQEHGSDACDPRGGWPRLAEDFLPAPPIPSGYASRFRSIFRERSNDYWRYRWLRWLNSPTLQIVRNISQFGNQPVTL